MASSKLSQEQATGAAAASTPAVPSTSSGIKGNDDGTKVYQFKITLSDSKPPIWRRIQVPEDYTFFELHVAIQDAMHGWQNYHLHDFKFPRGGPEFQLPPLDDYSFPKPLPEHKEKIKDYFKLDSRKKCVYLYDFGDSWEHGVLLESILPKDPMKTYPLILAGRRACPPEDSGSMFGYMDTLDILKDPRHKEYKQLREWVNSQTIIQRGDDQEFDPEKFVVADVQFSDPKIALQEVMGVWENNS